jgi:lysozyme family protein
MWRGSDASKEGIFWFVVGMIGKVEAKHDYGTARSNFFCYLVHEWIKPVNVEAER